jgi:hypothetical protein
MELSRQCGNDGIVYHTLGTVLLLPHSRDSYIITTLGTILLLPHSDNSNITTLSVPSVVIIELSRECGYNGTVPRVWL